jgi:hypothetical protein
MAMPFIPRLAGSTPAAPPALSPERQHLAHTITEWKVATEQLAAVMSAIASAQTVVYAQAAIVDAAEADIAQSKLDAAEFLTLSALGKAGTPPRTIRAARDAVRDATDGLDSARAAVIALEARKAENGKTFCEYNRAAAVRAVLMASPEVARALVAVQTIQAQLVEAGSALLFLQEAGALRIGMPGNRDYGGPTEADHAINRLHAPPDTWHALDRDGAAPYRAWAERLLTDASATFLAA